jgi:hypothetical protein
VWHTLSAGVLEQLATIFDEGGLRSAESGAPYKEQLAAVRTPLLLVAGDQDRQCPPDAARTTFNALDPARCRLLLLGPEHGVAAHYGHFDLIIGRSAPEDVYPHLLGWLERCDRPRATVPPQRPSEVTAGPGPFAEAR